MSILHPIQVVARLSGLTPHVIRVWEKRYGAVTPTRTGTNRRLYSDDELERLRLLARATGAGHRIGVIARLPVVDLRRLVTVLEPGGPGRVPGPESNGEETDAKSAGHPGRSQGRADFVVSAVACESGSDTAEPGLVGAALEATRSFSAARLTGVLERGVVELGHSGVIHRVICPLARELGERWQRGEVSAAHEHFASALIRDFLARMSRPFAVPEDAPRAVVATPAGQLHELGAVVVGAAVANAGWRVIYLGANLPAAEIAGAARLNAARAVLLSIVYPADDSRLGPELVQLRRFLTSRVAIICGGRAVGGYDGSLKEIAAFVPAGLPGLAAVLDGLRVGASPTCG